MPALVEGILVTVLGLVVLIESVRLTLLKGDALAKVDILGPAGYLMGLGLLMTGLGFTYLLSHLRKDLDKKKNDGKNRMKMASMLIVLIMYVFLINIIGYFFASVVFFALIFRIAGFRSWPAIGGLSLGTSAVFYLIFVHCLDIMFPAGVLFR
jgi:putative tricarboxylic transport membrane protein